MAAPTTAQRRILFVDDDTAYLEAIGGFFTDWGRGAWSVLTAENAGKALGLLQEHEVHAVVFDLKMPVVDGVQLLSLLNRKHPRVAKAVLTGFASDAERAVCLSQGADLFLEKPRDREGFEILFAMLNELVTVSDAEGFRGVLSRAGLPEVIQMECLSRHSLVLEVSSAAGTGEISICEGDIVHAQAGELSGEAAFNRILSWKGGEFSLKPFAEPPAHTIDGQWEFLLMEAARVRDEAVEAAEAPVEPPPAGAETPPTGWDTFVPGEAAPEPSGAAISPELFPPQIEEMLVCTPEGDLLYEWQSPNAEKRLTFLAFIAEKSRQLSLGLPLGKFDRIELSAERTRLIAQSNTERRFLVRSTRRD